MTTAAVVAGGGATDDAADDKARVRLVAADGSADASAADVANSHEGAVGVESAAGSAAEKSTVAAPCVVAARSIARDCLRPVKAAHVKRRACLPRLASCWHNPAAEPPSSSPPLSAPPRGVLPRQQKNESLVGLPAEGAQEQCGATWTRLEQSLGAPIARRTGGCCLKEMRIAQRSCDSRRCYFQGTAAPSRAGSASIASASRARFSSLPRERQTRRCAGHAPLVCETPVLTKKWARCAQITFGSW